MVKLTIAWLVAALALGCLARPDAAEAQPSAKGLPRIGLLATAASPFVEAFEEGLRARGYVDGQNIIIERPVVSGDPERFAALAADLVRLPVDAIVAPTTPAALAAQKATKTIPIVMVTASDPVGSGLVASLARPGGNITGTTIMGTDLAAKRLDLLAQVLPGVSRVGVLWNASHRAQAPALALALNSTQGAAKARGVTLVPVRLNTFDDFTSASAVIAKERPEALIVLPDPLSFVHRAKIVSLAASHRLPGMYPEREYIEAGGLMAYAADVADLYRRAAGYLDKILKGAKPANLPVEQPTKFLLVINRKTAKTLGIALPRSVLLRADQLIDP